jgi:2'-5' RNA ligase
MPRLFVAVDFPSEVREEIANLCHSVPQARFTPMNQLHLTLRFAGDIDDTTYHELAEELDAIHASPFDLTLKGVGFFPPRRDPTVLWVGVEENAALAALGDLVGEAMELVGIEPEKRKFHPHITIARFKQSPPVAKVMPFILRNSLFRVPVIPISEFHLYSSQLRQDGAVHTIESTYRLL